MQCRAHGSTFEFLFEFQTEFFSNFLFEFQVVRASNRSTIDGPLYVGLDLFSLLGSSSSSSVDASSFGCVVILSLYLMLKFVISSLIVDTVKSACKTLLDIYHGAFTIARRTLF